MEINNIPEIKNFFSYISKVLEIESILCYGSYATGLQDEKSDIDLLIIVKKLPLIAQLQNLYKLDGFKNIVFKNAEHWDSSWSMVNITLETMAGLKIEVGYNTTAWVKKVIKKLIENHEISFQEFPFRPYTLLGLLEYSKCLYDRNLFIANLKTKIRPFPIQLKKKIVQSQLPMLRDCYEDLLDNVERNIGILAYQFHVFMGLDAMIQLLWVINDVYDPASKRSEHYLFKLTDLPEGFIDLINKCLPRSYEHKDEFIKSFCKIKNYIENRIIALNLC